MKIVLAKPWCGWSELKLCLPDVNFGYALSYADPVVDMLLTLIEDSFERSAVAAEFDTEGSSWLLTVTNCMVTISEPEDMDSFDHIIAPSRMFSVLYDIEDFRKDICECIKKYIDEWAAFTVYVHNDDKTELEERNQWKKNTLARIEAIEQKSKIK